MLESIFGTIGALILTILKIGLFVLLSVFVVPSMIIMSFLHKPWEDMLNSVFTLDHF
ncbi:hypothetical protein H6776_02520 [Candidatus Nomurabacteria bacterium]|nr:hypothetical protein [Candidatus Nomurabacteria bacterium]